MNFFEVWSAEQAIENAKVPNSSLPQVSLMEYLDRTPKLQALIGLNLVRRPTLTEEELNLLNSSVIREGSINDPDFFGQTPLIIACISLHPEFVKWLLEHGASPFIKDRNGKDCFEIISSMLDYKPLDYRMHPHTAWYIGEERKKFTARAQEIIELFNAKFKK